MYQRCEISLRAGVQIEGDQAAVVHRGNRPAAAAKPAAHKAAVVFDIVALWWQVASGDFTPARVDNVAYMVSQDTIDEVCEVIAGQKHDMFCLNDPNWEVDFDALSARLHEAFEAILPDKCSFEK